MHFCLLPERHTGLSGQPGSEASRGIPAGEAQVPVS